MPSTPPTAFFPAGPAKEVYDRDWAARTYAQLPVLDEVSATEEFQRRLAATSGRAYARAHYGQHRGRYYGHY